MTDNTIESTIQLEEVPAKPSRAFNVYSELTPDQAEKRRTYMREYQRSHPDKFKKANQRYVAKMRDLKEYRAKIYRDSETQQKIIACDCGSSIKYHFMKAHQKTKKHINYMTAKTMDETVSS
jgi:hypothetical protein